MVSFSDKTNRETVPISLVAEVSAAGGEYHLLNGFNGGLHEMRCL